MALRKIPYKIIEDFDRIPAKPHTAGPLQRLIKILHCQILRLFQSFATVNSN